MPVSSTEEEAALAFESTPQLVVPITRHRSSRGKSKLRRMIGIVMGCLVVGGVVGGAIWGSFWLLHWAEANRPEVPSAQGADAANYRFTPPKTGWEGNREALIGLGVNFALSRREPGNSLALYYRDFKTRLPTEAEMLDLTVTKLRGYFKPLEYESKVRPDFKLGGRPVALSLEFQGTDPDSVPMSGEVLVVAYRGIGYWFFNWCPQETKDTASADWEGLRGGFTLLNNREGWSETPPETEAVDVPELPYQVRFVKGLWRVEAPEKWDSNGKARVALVGSDPTESRHAGKAANFRLLVLDKTDTLKDAVTAARAYLEQIQKEEGYNETVITVIKDKKGKDLDVPANIGNERGHLVKLQVRNSESRERYVVLGVLHEPEQVLMLMCDCDWNRKDFWDVEFTHQLNGVRKKR